MNKCKTWIKEKLIPLRLRLVRWLVGDDLSVMFNTRIYGNWTKIKVSTNVRRGQRCVVSGVSFDNTMDRGGTEPGDVVGTIARAMEMASPDGPGKAIFVLAPSCVEVDLSDCDGEKPQRAMSKLIVSSDSDSV